MMPTSIGYVCCHEVHQVVKKIQENDAEINFITLLHDSFHGVCLNRRVLQVAYFAYRERYGSVEMSELYCCTMFQST